MNTYIVRIYREEKDKPRNLAGIVEEVGAEGKLGFTNYDELWEILNPANNGEPRSNAQKRVRAEN